MTRSLTHGRPVWIPWIGLMAGPALAIALALLLPESRLGDQGESIRITPACRMTAAVGVWMAVWWVTEAIPVFATALLPLALLPTTGAVPIRQAAAPYAHEMIFLFMGGFIIALAMQRWGLDRRIALRALALVGTRPARVVAAFMVITAGMSMGVSNTATTVMMLPIALSVIAIAERNRPPDQRDEFAPSLLLGIAYAASIGGIGTLIGTPPNLFLASFVQRQLGVEISFVRWMGVGLPLVVVFLPAAWVLLTKILHPVGDAPIEIGTSFAREKLRLLGPMKRGEWATLGVFGLAASAWILRPLLVGWTWGDVRPLAGLSDPGIAMLAALALFVIPVDLRERQFVMDWDTAVQLPWGLLVLFGGGLSLAAAIQANGVDALLGSHVGALAGLPTLVLVLAAIVLLMLLTELTSNTAAIATMLPILAGLAPALGVNAILLIVPAALAASCAFMLPVATPPNAVVFGSGLVTIPQMLRAGVWLDLIGIVLITGAVYALAIPLFGV